MNNIRHRFFNIFVLISILKILIEFTNNNIFILLGICMIELILILYISIFYIKQKMLYKSNIHNKSLLLYLVLFSTSLYIDIGKLILYLGG